MRLLRTAEPCLTKANDARGCPEDSYQDRAISMPPTRVTCDPAPLSRHRLPRWPAESVSVEQLKPHTLRAGFGQTKEDGGNGLVKAAGVEKADRRSHNHQQAIGQWDEPACAIGPEVFKMQVERSYRLIALHTPRQHCDDWGFRPGGLPRRVTRDRRQPTNICAAAAAAACCRPSLRPRDGCKLPSWR